MEIRDTRNGEWYWVYTALLADPHLFSNDKLVYSAISTFGGHQVIHPTIEQIAQRCGVSERGAQLSLNKLEEVGYLEVQKSTGRGNANTYYLLKKPKGCNQCTFYKGRNEQQERVQPSAGKGAMAAPHIDKIDKIDTSEAELRTVTTEESEIPPKRSNAKYPHSKEVFALFPKPQASWVRNTTERESAEFLYARGLDDVRQALAFVKKHKGEQFLPKVTKPSDLERKWLDLVTYEPS